MVTRHLLPLSSCPAPPGTSTKTHGVKLCLKVCCSGCSTLLYKTVDHIPSSVGAELIKKPCTRVFLFQVLIKVFFGRISKVCKLWYKVAASATFWEDVDLSGDNIVKTKRGFTWLCKNRLKFAKSLNLSSWECLVGKDIQVTVIYVSQ